MTNYIKKVSIILVNYNGLEDTVSCVESLQKICYKNFEIIVVDNGSADDYKLLKKGLDGKNVTILRTNNNLGFSGGNNIGIKYALESNADYVLLLNNDTVVESDFLNPMVQISDEYNDQVVVTCKIMYESRRNIVWYAGGSFSKITSRTVSYGINKIDDEYLSVKYVTFASGCCLLIPCSVARKVGLMNEDYFLYCEDTDYCLRVIRCGYKIIFEPKSKIYHKVSASTNRLPGMQTYYLVRNKLYIIKEYVDVKFKLLAYGYLLFETIKRLMTREYDFDSAKEGVKDFCGGICGRKE